MNKRIFLYTFLVFISANSLFAVTNEWVAGGTAGDWEDPANWDEGRVPQAGDDVLIDGSYTVTLESSPTIESLTLRAGADLIIASTFTLNVEDNSGSSDGVDLAGTGTTLTIHGTLNSSGHTGSGADGIEINSGSSLTLSVSGSIYISNVDGYGIDINNDALAVTVSGNITINDVGKAGIALNADFINSGTISITNPGTNEDGISTNGNDGEVPDRTFTNSGTITVVGGVNGMDISTAWTLTNTGTIILSGASVALVDSGSDIDNFGTFKGDGTVENGNNGDFNFQPGSTVAPGLSIGKLTFRDNIDFTDVTFDIEINGATNYDQVVVGPRLESPPADITLSETILNLSGSYMPVGGEVFMILEKVEAGAIDGTFKDLPEGSMIAFNGANLIISYTGGDGNDMTASFDSPLPVELIDFSARAMESEVILSWTTATEINNDFFTIERSLDGRTFQKIATIPGKGNSLILNEYSFLDENPLNGINYYRIKQTDYDRQFSYSDIIIVDFEKDKAIKIYPTFVEDVLIIETGNDLSGDLTIVIHDVTGNEYQSFIIPSQPNRRNVTLNGLIPGSYFVLIYNNKIVETHMFIKM